MPSIDRAAEICEALDLEFYVGPAREGGGRRGVFAESFEARTLRGGERGGLGLGAVEKHLQGLVGAVLAAGGNPFPADLQDETLTGLVATHDAPPGA